MKDLLVQLMQVTDTGHCKRLHLAPHEEGHVRYSHALPRLEQLRALLPRPGAEKCATERNRDTTLQSESHPLSKCSVRSRHGQDRIIHSHAAHLQSPHAGHSTMRTREAGQYTARPQPSRVPRSPPLLWNNM